MPARPELEGGAVAEGVDALGRFHLLRLLGTGGMATVWHAVDARDGRQVALKRMLPRLAWDLEEARAFRHEAELGLRLRHGNIVSTLEFGETTTSRGPERYMVLELLRGHPLSELFDAAVERRLPIPIGVAIRIVRDAARGLAHAHQLPAPDGNPLGVVHRDVSPENLFVCDSGITKIIDFGVARANHQAHASEPGEIKGKLGYLAPEALRGLSPDARVDVYGLGVVLHELLTGRPLFRGNTDEEVLYRLVSDQIPSPETLRPDVPPALAALTLRALHRDRDRRLPSCGALAEAIDAVGEACGVDRSTAAVQATMRSLHPHDVAAHAAQDAAAQRLFAHLEAPSGSIAAAAPAPARPRRAPPRLARAAAALALLSVTAFAAVGASRLWHPRAVAHSSPVPAVSAPAPEAIAPPTPARHFVDLPAPDLPASPPKIARHKRGSGWQTDGCPVYISMRGGAKKDCRRAAHRDR